MGGWLMLLTALALVQRDGPGRVAGLVGIAAAPDFTDWGFSDAEKAIILAEGELREETSYSDQPYVTTRGFFQSGEANRLLDQRNPPQPAPCACCTGKKMATCRPKSACACRRRWPATMFRSRWSRAAITACRATPTSRC